MRESRWRTRRRARSGAGIDGRAHPFPLISQLLYSANQSQCYVRLPLAGLNGRTVRFTDLMGNARYDRGGDDIAARGLYLDLPAWGYHVFEIEISPISFYASETS
jgi:hypothetical protein